MYSKAYELIVQVNGRPVKEYVHDNVSYIEGKRNSRYVLKLKNNTPKRALAVVSVDGLDVLKGKPAENSDSGYIVDAYSSLEIKGYRIDDDKVAEFMFDDGKKSYSSFKTKNEKNTGVIGVRFFEEKVKTYVPPTVEHHHHHHNHYPVVPWKPYTQPYFPFDPYWYGTTTCGGISSSNQSFTMNSGGTTCNNLQAGSTTIRSSKLVPGAASKGSSDSRYEDTSMAMFACDAASAPLVPKFDLGTAWGDQVQDKVRTVEFDKGALITQIEIYYASRKSLEKIGINFDERKTVYQPSRPQAFGSNNYCEPPTNWKK